MHKNRDFGREYGIQKLFLIIIISSISFLTILKADTVRIDLSSQMSIDPSIVEVSYDFNTTITIKNENPSNTTELDGKGAKIHYHVPAGSTYSGVYNEGSGWKCNDSLDSDNNLTCKYNQALTNEQTSNPLVITLKAPPSAGDFNGTATVEASSTDRNPDNDTSTAQIKCSKSNLHIQKAVSDDKVGLGDNFTYTIRVSNPSNGINPTAKARDVTLSDTLPSGIHFVSLSDSNSWCTQSGSTISCSGIDLDENASASITITVYSSSEGNITNSAFADANSSDYNALPISASATNEVESADIKLTKKLLDGLDANNAEVNSTVRYNISVTNLKHTVAKDINFTDTLPSGVAFVSISKGDWNCSGTSTIKCSIDSLAYNEIKDVNITVRMPSTHQTISNSATAHTSINEGGSTSNNSDSIATSIKGTDLKIDINPKGNLVKIGSNFTYTINVINRSNLVDAKDIVVTEKLNNKMTYISDTGGCSVSGNILTCPYTSLAKGGSYEFNVTVRMPTDMIGAINNRVKVTNSVDDERLNNNDNQSVINLYGADLNITKDANVTTIGLGEAFTYTLKIKNLNDVNATDVNITDTLPTGVQITSIAPGSFNCPSSFPIIGTFYCSKDNFAGSATDTITLIAKAPTTTPGDITNNVKVAHLLNSNDGSDSAKVTVTGASLDINKSASSKVAIGGLIDYNITVKNTSFTNEENLTVVDDLSKLGSGYTINSIIDTDEWNCSKSTATVLKCTRDKLALGGTTTTIHFDVNVPLNAVLGEKTNEANVTTATEPKPTKTATAHTLVGAADVVVVPPIQTTAIANENTIFTVKVRNDGNIVAKDVNLTNIFNVKNVADANFSNIKIDCNGGTSYVTIPNNTCQLGDIAVNGVKTINISAVAPNYDSNFLGHSKITNSFSATTSTQEKDETNNERNVTIENRGSDIVIYKDAKNSRNEIISEATSGEVITYELYIKNQFEANATNIKLSDRTIGNGSDKFIFVAGTLSYNSSDWNCTLNSSTSFDCTYQKDLPFKGETSRITIKAKAPSSIGAIDSDRINEANVSTNTAEKDIGTTNRIDRAVTIRGVDLNISKSVTPTKVKPAKSVTYTITVNDNSNVDAFNVYVDDTLPSGFTAISTSGCTNDASSVSGRSIHCLLGDISKRSAKTFTILATAPSSTGTYTNIAKVDSDTYDINSSNNRDYAKLIVKNFADLVPHKLAPDEAKVGSTFTYTISLKNIGDSTAYGAEINDTIPTTNGTSYVSGSLTTLDSNWNCSISGQDIHCYTKDSNLSIPKGYSKNIAKFKVKVGSSPYELDNTVVTDTKSTETNSTNNSYTANTKVINTNINLLARKLINGVNYGGSTDQMTVGSDINYTLQVKNGSFDDSNITDVNFTDIIPSNLEGTPTITSSSRFNCSKSGNILFCSMKNGTISPLQTSEGWITVATINAKAISEDNYDTTNEANNHIKSKFKAETSLNDKYLADNAPTTGDGYLHTDTLVLAGADLTPYKLAPEVVEVNSTFTYTISLKNIGVTTAYGAEINDTIPTTNGTSYISGSLTTLDSNWNCSISGQDIHCYTKDSNLSIPSGYDEDIAKFQVKVGSTPYKLNNTVVTDTKTPESNKLNNDYTAHTDVSYPYTDLVARKLINGSYYGNIVNRVTTGTNITYTLQVRNSSFGDANITDVNFTDIIPSNLEGTLTITPDSRFNCNKTGSANPGDTLICSMKSGATSPLRRSEGWINVATISGKAISSSNLDTVNEANNHIINRYKAQTSLEEKFHGNNAPTTGDGYLHTDTLVLAGTDIVPYKSAPNVVEANATFTYTISLKNIGTSTAYGAEINDTIPTTNGASYVSGSLTTIDSNWNCTISGQDIHCYTKDSNLSIPSGYDKKIAKFDLKASSTPTELNNTVVADTKTAETNRVNNSYTAHTNVIVTNSNIDLLARKLINGVNYARSTNQVDIGADINYTLQVKNGSFDDSNITDVNFTDIIPSNLEGTPTITSSSRFNCSKSGNILFCSMKNGTTSPLKTSEGWITVATISAEAISASNFDKNSESNNHIINKYKAETSLDDKILSNNAPTTGDGYLHTDTLVHGSNMSIVKSISKNKVGANSSVSYTLKVRNIPSSSTAKNVVVKDKLPTGTTFVSASGSNWSCSESSHIVTCNYSKDMPPSNTTSDITINIKAPNTSSTIFTNEANVTNDTPELKALLRNNKARVSAITYGTDIIVSKSGPVFSKMDENVTYTVTVTNISKELDAENIVVTDTLFNNAIYEGNLSSTHWSTLDPIGKKGSIVFKYDQNLSKDSNVSFSFDVKLPHYAGTVRNYVEANTTTAEKSFPNVSYWDIRVNDAKLVFRPVAQAPYPVGAYKHHEYNLTIRNQGIYDAEDINVTIDLNNSFSGDGWSEVNGSGVGWNCDNYDAIKSQLICHLPKLEGGDDSSVLTITSNAPNYNGMLTSKATVTRKEEINPTGNKTNLNTLIRGSDLKIIKYATDPDPKSDGLWHKNSITIGTKRKIEFNLSVSNINLGLAKDINITDTLPSGFSDFNVTNSGGWSCSFIGNVYLTCTRGSFDSEANATDIIYSATTSLATGVVKNIVDINTTTKEVSLSNNHNEININVANANPDIGFSPSKTKVAFGEVFAYTLEINNTGVAAITNLNATDILPSDFTYVDSNGSDSDWNCTLFGNKLSCDKPSIDAYSGTALLKINVKAPSTKMKTYHNDINLTSISLTTNPLNKIADDVQVVGADLKVDINATPINVLEDRNVTYTLNIKNINLSTAHDINITQKFSSLIQALYIKNNGGSDCNISDDNQSLTCSLASLDFNSDINITTIATMPKNLSSNTIMTSAVDINTTTLQEDTSNDNKSFDVIVHPFKPVVDYRFEECKWDGTSKDVNDSSSGINGKAIGSAKTVSYQLAKDDNNFSTKWRVAKFDGSGYIKIDDNPKLHITKNQTICAWVRPTDLTKRRNIVAKAYGGEGTITQETNGKVAYYYGKSGLNGSPFQRFASTVALNNNKWNHICIVRDLENKKLKWYINNAKRGIANANYNLAVAGSNALFIGTGYTNNYKGYIDEVKIYDVALDERAINDIYNYERSGKNYDGTNRAETVCGVDLEITKTVSSYPYVGADNDFLYTITVKNNSPEPLTSGFFLQDTMPSGLATLSIVSKTLSNADTSCTSSGYDFNCTMNATGVLNQNETRTFAIRVTAPNMNDINITNSVAIKTGLGGIPGQLDINSSNDESNVSVLTKGTDLSVAKTAQIDDDDGNLVHYTMTITNLSSVATAKGVSIIDTYDNRLTLVIPPTGVSCVTPVGAHYFTCNLPDIAPGSSYTLTSTMSANVDGVVNEINVTSHTVDINISNNYDSITMDLNNSGAMVPTKLKDGFRRHVSINNYGNMIAIGNTILKAENYTPTTSLTDINTSYVNVASQPLNSSSATLHIPENNVTIEYAGLYWGGHIKGENSSITLTDPFNIVKLTTPSGTTYTVVGGDQEDGNITTDDNATGFYRFKRYNTSLTRVYYVAEANVTDILREEYNAHGNINGAFTISDINVSSGLDNRASFIPDDTSASHWSYFTSGFFGGWELVVIYSVNHRDYRAIKYKNSVIFDGFKILMPRSPDQRVSLDINVSGFITPSDGDIESSLFPMVLAGDQTLPYESLSVTDSSNTAHLVKEGVSNTNNIFNDTITLKNLDNTSINKNLNLSYNPGIDLDQFDLTSRYSGGSCTSTPCYLNNSQSSTIVKVEVRENNETEDDNITYKAQYAFVSMLGFNTQLYTPDFIDTFKECFKEKEPGSSSNDDWIPCSDPLHPIHRGDIIKYRITVINSGVDDAINVTVKDVLPKELDFNGSCSSPNGDINATHIYDLPDGLGGGIETDYNSTLRSISGACVDPDYDKNETLRDECIADLKAIILDGNETRPFGTLPDGNVETMDLIDPAYSGASCANDGNNTTLKFQYSNFAKKSVAWIEFKTVINNKAKYGESFENAVDVSFTSWTLFNAGILDLQTQESEPVESGAVKFNWKHVSAAFKDPGRSTVGTKIVRKPFDLNLSLDGISTFDLDTDGNTTMTISNIRIVDAYNGGVSNISSYLSTPATITISDTSLGWNLHNVLYNKASKELGFKFNLRMSYKNEYNETKTYPDDFNSSASYAGDVFTTRPKAFTLSVNGASSIGGYTVAKAAQGTTLNVSAIDASDLNASSYNAILTKANGISISLDPNFSTNPSCINLNDLNISNINFTNGYSSIPNTKYSEVGVIKIYLKDANWTLKDQMQNDCVANSGANLGTTIGCNVEGNTSSLIFTPDHFDFNSTYVSDFGGNFTYMVTDPANEQVYGKIITNLISKNADGNITRFFSNTCFADKVKVNLKYNVDSQSLSDLNLSIANESNLSDIESNATLSATNNSFNTFEQNSSFVNGTRSMNIRAYMNKNKTTPLNPAIVDMRVINGSINNYLGVAGVNVAPQDINISTTNDIHFIYGRVHAPNYSSDNDEVNATIYYEGYCEGCDRSKYPSLGNEDSDSVYWYINSGQNNLSDGNISSFVQPANTKITITPGSSLAINSGTEIHDITYNGATYPYRERVDMNVSNWLIYDPYNPNASVSSFFVDFSKYNDWAGVGAMGKTVDINISTKGSKRIEW